jgi:multidrug resistance efflux pump
LAIKNENLSKISDAQKLNALGSVLRLGHEAFQKKGIDAVASHILNNSKLVLSYDRSCLIDMHSNFPKMVAVMGQPQVNNNSEYCVNVKALLRGFTKIKEKTIVTKELLVEMKQSSAVIKAFDYFTELSSTVVLVPIVPPEKIADNNEGELYVWMLEFKDPIPNQELNLLTLLANHYSEAIWYNVKRNETKFKEILRKRKIFTVKNIFAGIFILFIISLFFKIPHNVVASFEFIPAEESVRYAPYSGIISESYFRNGENVKKGDLIIKYDTQELSYQLSDAVNLLEQTSAELDFAKQNSFTDVQEFSKIKILQLKKAKYNIEINRLKWYLKRSEIIADESGILLIDDNKKWRGKLVEAGSKLFDIVNSKNIIPKVEINESEASVLGENTKITLFLFSQPEKAIYGDISSVSPIPMETETGQFCYIIKMELDEVNPNYIFGMRGIARVQGDKVALGYYLFKNTVLWWRKI